MPRPPAMKYQARGDFIRELRTSHRYTVESLAKALEAAAKSNLREEGKPGSSESYSCSKSTVGNLQRSLNMPSIWFDALARVFNLPATEFYVDEMVEKPCVATPAVSNAGRKRLHDACEGLLQGSRATRDFLLEVHNLDEELTAAELTNQILNQRPGPNNPLTFVSKCVRHDIPQDDNESVADIGRSLFRLAEILIPVSVSPSEAAAIQDYLSNHPIGGGTTNKSPAGAAGRIGTKYSLIAAAAIATNHGFSVDAREERRFEDLDESDNPSGVRRLGMLPPEGSLSRSLVYSFADGLARILSPYDFVPNSLDSIAFVQDALRSQADEAEIYFCVLFPPELTPSTDDLGDLAKTFPELILLASDRGQESPENITVLNQIKKIRDTYGQYARKDNQ